MPDHPNRSPASDRKPECSAVPTRPPAGLHIPLQIRDHRSRKDPSRDHPVQMYLVHPPVFVPCRSSPRPRRALRPLSAASAPPPVSAGSPDSYFPRSRPIPDRDRSKPPAGSCTHLPSMYIPAPASPYSGKVPRKRLSAGSPTQARSAKIACLLFSSFLFDFV